MKKFIIVLLTVFSLVGIGYAAFVIHDNYSSYVSIDEKIEVHYDVKEGNV